MFNNILLDLLPDNYEGYLIDTDFQTGIQIMQIMQDCELSEYERLATSIQMMYIDMPQDIDTAMQGLKWYLSGWDHDNHEHNKEENEPVIDYDIDQWRIYSAFLSQYKIDLNKDKIHWFVFMGLLMNLNECAFTKVVEIRSRKFEKGMTRNETKALKKLKRLYSINKNQEKKEEEYTEEEKERIKEFMKFAKISK